MPWIPRRLNSAPRGAQTTAAVGAKSLGHDRGHRLGSAIPNRGLWLEKRPLVNQDQGRVTNPATGKSSTVEADPAGPDLHRAACRSHCLHWRFDRGVADGSDHRSKCQRNGYSGGLLTSNAKRRPRKTLTPVSFQDQALHFSLPTLRRCHRLLLSSGESWHIPCRLFDRIRLRGGAVGLSINSAARAGSMTLRSRTQPRDGLLQDTVLTADSPPAQAKNTLAASQLFGFGLFCLVPR